MCEDVEDCKDCCMSVCSSDNSVLPVPMIPRSIQVPGPTETPSVQFDDHMCLDSDSEQDDNASRLKRHNLLSKAKQLIDFENQSLTSSTSTAETLTVDSYSTTSNDSKEFNGFVESYLVDPKSIDIESHALDPKEVATIERTPATIAIAGSIGTVKSRKFLKVLLDTGSTATLIKRSVLPKGVQGKPLN